MKYYTESSQIVMTPLGIEHAAHIVRWRNNPINASRFLTKKIFTLDSQIKWTEQQLSNPCDHTYIAMHQGEPIGMVALYNISFEQHHAEYGRILVDDKWRRKGIGSVISHWITNMGFAELNLSHIYANCYAENIPILDLLQSLGYQIKFYQKNNNTYQKIAHLEVTHEGWNSYIKQHKFHR